MLKIVAVMVDALRGLTLNPLAFFAAFSRWKLIAYFPSKPKNKLIRPLGSNSLYKNKYENNFSEYKSIEKYK